MSTNSEIYFYLHNYDSYFSYIHIRINVINYPLMSHIFTSREIRRKQKGVYNAFLNAVCEHSGSVLTVTPERYANRLQTSCPCLLNKAFSKHS